MQAANLCKQLLVVKNPLALLAVAYVAALVLFPLLFFWSIFRVILFLYRRVTCNKEKY